MTPQTAALCERVLRMRLDHDMGFSHSTMRRKYQIPERDLVSEFILNLNQKAVALIEVDREVERLRSVTGTATQGTQQDPSGTVEPTAPDVIQAARDALTRAGATTHPADFSVRSGEVRQDDDGC